jgi:DNA-directed RNA polymerase subunit beta
MKEVQKERTVSVGKLPQKTFAVSPAPRIPLPDLIEPQHESYRWFAETALKEIFTEFSPISDYSDKKFELKFKKYEIGSPKCTPEYAKENKLTYEAPLRAHVILKNKT